MKKSKIIANALSLIIIASASTPSIVVFSETNIPTRSAVIQNNENGKVFSLEENKLYTLDTLLENTKLNDYEKEKLTETILTLVKQAESNKMTRSVMTTVLQRLSHSQVQQIVNSSNPIPTLIGMIPLVGNVYSAIQYFVDSEFKTAARNGWGMEFVIMVDQNNPTTSGIRFAWRYVK